MGLFVIGDEDTVMGFRFAGIDGTVVENAEQAARALAEALKREETALIMPERVANMIRKEVDRLRYGEALPLIVEIPGPEGAATEGPSLYRLVREAVGIKF